MKSMLTAAVVAFAVAGFAQVKNPGIPQGIDSLESHKENVVQDKSKCKVSVYKSAGDEEKLVAVVQEQVEGNEETAKKELKKQLAKRDNLDPTEKDISFDVNCR